MLELQIISKDLLDSEIISAGQKKNTKMVVSKHLTRFCNPIIR